MFSKELEDLIDASLQDGILEEHEKQALIKRALIEGVDITELDIYINSKLQKRVMEEKVEKPKAKSSESKQSNRCPFCGSPIPPLSKTCPGCGAAVAVQTTGDRELFELIDAMERSMIQMQTCSTVDFPILKAEAESLIRKAKLFYGDNKKMQMTVFELENRINECSKKHKPRLIDRNFFYFFIMCVLVVLFIAAASIGLDVIGLIFLAIMILLYLYRTRKFIFKDKALSYTK